MLLFATDTRIIFPCVLGIYFTIVTGEIISLRLPIASGKINKRKELLVFYKKASTIHLLFSTVCFKKYPTETLRTQINLIAFTLRASGLSGRKS